MARRRKSSYRAIPLWAIAIALVCWGLWQAENVRRTVVAETMRTSAGQPAPAAEAANGTGSGAQGGEPWTTTAGEDVTTLHADTITLIIPEASEPSLLQPTPTFDAPLTAEELFQRGRRLLESGQIAAGRFALNAALARTMDESQAAELRGILGNLNAPIFMGTGVLADDPAARYVDIQSGDTFLSLARSYGTPAAYLQLINPTLNPNNLKVFTGVKIVQGPFHARVVKSAGRLDLYARELYVASCGVDFPEGNLLPKGEYQITNGSKLQVGSRFWLGFEGREPATEEISGWMFGSGGPRGNSIKDRASGMHVSESDIQQLYNVLVEGRSHVRVDP